MDFSINYFAVVAGAVSAMLLGYLWYGPLFGKKWMALMGISKESMSSMGASAKRGYILQMVGALVLSYVLAHFVEIAGVSSIADGVTLGLWAWLGFMAPVMVGSVAWEGKPWMLFVINAGYQLINVLIIVSILTLWQ